MHTHTHTQEEGKKREYKGKKRRNELAHIQRYEHAKETI